MNTNYSLITPISLYTNAIYTQLFRYEKLKHRCYFFRYETLKPRCYSRKNGSCNYIYWIFLSYRVCKFLFSEDFCWYNISTTRAEALYMKLSGRRRGNGEPAYVIISSTSSSLVQGTGRSSTHPPQLFAIACWISSALRKSVAAPTKKRSVRYAFSRV